MPTYDYQCECGHVQEEIRGVNDKSPVPCERCGKSSIRQFSPPAGSYLVGMQAEKPGGYYDIQLGMQVTSKRQLREEAKKRGWEMQDPPERNRFTGEKLTPIRSNPPPKWAGPAI